MRSNGICLGCIYRKQGGRLPCSHPIWDQGWGEEMVPFASHITLATACENVRKCLALKYKEGSWDVVECRGRISSGGEAKLISG